MDYIDAIEALYDYVNANADSGTIIAFNNAYDKFIEWQSTRSQAIKETSVIADEILRKHFHLEIA